ncbi:TPA: aldo/keto reductase [Clostridium botulinum]|uniref:aldo/keto reductase n=1 Tax=Clostridium botulinum TaxID=1491 RepID=UPI00330C91FC|nr:aldo/keto reductase [Clostridium botulinum]
MKQIILGTAQLGLNYGVNNPRGKPSLREAYEILDTAYDNGIKILDTAEAYGDSEKIIGEYMSKTGNKFNVITKLSPLNNNNKLFDQIIININKSLYNLKLSSLYGYLVHNFSDVYNNIEIMDILYNEKRDGKIENIGISIYEPEELEYIIEYLSEKVDIVQIPLNIFDLRWIKEDLLLKANKCGIKIAARSIYLQGLFFADKYVLQKIHPKAYNYVNTLKELCNKKREYIEQIAMSFVKSVNSVDFILTGCENKNQLTKNIEMFNKGIKFSKDEYEFIFTKFNDIEEKIYDPRMWNI